MTVRQLAAPAMTKDDKSHDGHAPLPNITPSAVDRQVGIKHGHSKLLVDRQHRNEAPSQSAVTEACSVDLEGIVWTAGQELGDSVAGLYRGGVPSQ